MCASARISRPPRHVAALPRAAEERLCLREARYMGRREALQRGLELVRFGLGESALRRRRTAFAPETDIFVVAHGVLSQPLHRRVLVRQFGDPVFHVLHHFALDLGITVVEIWVESAHTTNKLNGKIHMERNDKQALQDIFGYLMHIHGGVVPSLRDQFYCMSLTKRD